MDIQAVATYHTVDIEYLGFLDIWHTMFAHHAALTISTNNMAPATIIPYSGKFSREKTFTNFAIFQPSAKVFSMKF